MTVRSTAPRPRAGAAWESARRRIGTPAAIGEVWAASCLLELDALKPGNVHRHAGGHVLALAQFEASARAVAAAVAAPDAAPAGALGLGVLQAIEATRAAVDTNTNLGIVLLCVPLVHAALALLAHDGAGPWPRPRFDAVLRGLLRGAGIDDARLAYRAIRLAVPGGLGSAATQDVRDEPDVTLLHAMALARHRDRIARTWATDFGEIRRPAASRWARAWRDAAPPVRRARGLRAVQAAGQVYLWWLARADDTLIVRRHGPAVARRVRRKAAAIGAGASHPRRQRCALLTWDAALKRRRVNPGTSADLTVATALYVALTAPDAGSPARNRRSGTQLRRFDSMSEVCR